METVCASFVSYVVHHRLPGIPLWVIFDSYETSTTKDSEQKRRRVEQTVFPDVIVEGRTPVPGNKSGFLSNRKNKQNVIKLLSKYLTKAGVEVEHAGDEGDADTVIVKKALELTLTQHTVIVIADDTDILILLIHHASPSANLFLQTKQNAISIKMAKAVLGREMSECLLFAHAMSGCDTTSALFGIGKIKHMKLLQTSQQWRIDVLVFGKTDTAKENIREVGERFVQGLYSGGSKTKGLDKLRYLNVVSPKHVPFERMPPSSRAMFYHSLRVHQQVSTWRYLRTVLNKEEYGYRVEENSVIPVITDKAPAPAELLVDIRCSCMTSKHLCASCSCSKKGLSCSIHCKCQLQCENSSNIRNIDMTD